MSGKARELSDKEASDQVTESSGEVSTGTVGAAHGEVAQAITSTDARPVPIEDQKQPAVGRPLGRGFGNTRFDNVAPNPNDRKHIGEDPTGEQNKKLHEDFQAKAESEAGK